MEHVGLIIMHELTWKDISEGSVIEDTFDQQAFFLCRFFEISRKDLDSMLMEQIYPMVEQLNVYFTEVAKGDIPVTPMESREAPAKKNFAKYNKPIKNRWSILDL